MPTWRRLLVAEDFSEHAAAALETAISLAQELGARVEIVHVYQRPVEMLTPYEIALPDSVVVEVRKAASERLKGSIEKVRAAGLQGAAHLREGPPAQSIVALAGELPADLIVLGTRGLTGLKHALLGSVAERTLRTAPCPVLAVKTPDEAS
jgi:nucleotide-binding universal stress UspA family protein